ncbi:MAG TPA: hypothetical protein VHD63_10475 [Ktedonobacteraceae bacterium]|nr:hypothetical protein [Ktedonobacteraceae bacterium]
MIPGNDVTVASKRDTGARRRWHKPTRCSICKNIIWFYPIALREPLGAPEPRQQWQLCKACHEALLMEMHRSPLRSPTRLRIAMGLVAAERSPDAYNTSSHIREQREFAVIMWLLFAFGLLHLVLFVVIFAAAK